MINTILIYRTPLYFSDNDKRAVKAFKRRTGARHAEAGITAIIEI